MSNKLLTRDEMTGELVRGLQPDAQLRQAVAEVCNELSAVTMQRVGAMDTNSRADEINRTVATAVTSCVLKLRAALGE